MTRCVKRLLVASLRCTTLPSASLHTSPRLCDIPVVPFLIEQEGRGERAYNIYSRLLKDRIICVMGGLSRYNPKSAKQKPLMSYIVGDDTRVPSRSYQPPIAVKRGPPSTGLGHEFNGATDIWIYKDAADTWEPPSEHREVLDRAECKIFEEIYKDAADTWEPPSEHREVLDRTKCKIFEEVIKLASESKTPGQITPEEKRRSDLWMADQKLETFIEGSYPRATGTWPMKRLCGLWLRYLSESISDGWPNGKGKMALYYLFMTATVVCEMSEDRQIDLPYCLPTIEGQGPLNKGNGKYAIRAVDTGEQVDLLRGKSQWEVESGYWGYRYIIPDVSLEVSPSSSEGFLQPTGWMFGEVNSLDDHVMLDQATLQALRGLVDLTQTAAVVVHPKELYFIHLNVEKGFLVRRWKQYNVIKRGIADHTQYVEFFRDIVLYLRNTYYAKDAFDW